MGDPLTPQHTHRWVDGEFLLNGCMLCADDAARAAAPPVEPEYWEYVWLIERGQQEGLEHTEWWGVVDARTGARGWHHSALAADRFESQADAEKVISRFNLPNHPFNARAVEHGFVRAAAPPVEQPDPVAGLADFDGGHSIAPDGTPYWSEPRPADLDQWLIAEAPLLRDAYVAYVVARVDSERAAAPPGHDPDNPDCRCDRCWAIRTRQEWPRERAAAPPVDLPCGYCSRDFPHSHSKAILTGPDPSPAPVAGLREALHESIELAMTVGDPFQRRERVHAAIDAALLDSGGLDVRRG